MWRLVVGIVMPGTARLFVPRFRSLALRDERCGLFTYVVETWLTRFKNSGKSMLTFCGKVTATVTPISPKRDNC